MGKPDISKKKCRRFQKQGSKSIAFWKKARYPCSMVNEDLNQNEVQCKSQAAVPARNKPPIPMQTYAVGDVFGSWRVVSVHDCDLEQSDSQTVRYTAECDNCGLRGEKSNRGLQGLRRASGCGYQPRPEPGTLPIGKIYGNWRVVNGLIVTQDGAKRTLCECQCPELTRRFLSLMRLSVIESHGLGTCGCSYNRAYRSPNYKHGERGTTLYNKWRYYTITKRSAAWKEFAPFKEWACLHGYQDGLLVRRLNKSLPLSESNCVFLPPLQKVELTPVQIAAKVERESHIPCSI